MTDILSENPGGIVAGDQDPSEILNIGGIDNIQMPEGVPDMLTGMMPSGEGGEEEGFNPLQEVASVVGGGAVDAVESVGDFAELTGDTLKTGLNHIFGAEADPTQNPFDEAYIHGDGGFLDIPDRIEGPGGMVLWEDSQPKTAIGKFGRGLVEFGILTAGTAGIGGATLGGARLGARSLAAARSMGIGSKGARFLKFLSKGAKVGSEGAIADLVSTSSEHANIMNLAQENIPWAVPIIGEMVAIAPEDNPWTARFKSIIAGAGLNYVGHAIGAIYKGAWGAGRARKSGKSVDEANAIGNDIAAKDFEDNMALDEGARTDMALDDWQNGKGVSRADNLDEHVRQYNPERYDEWASKRGSELDEDIAVVDEIEVEAHTRGEAEGDIWDAEAYGSDKQFEAQANRPLSEFVNEDQFSQTEKATRTVPPDAVKSHVGEAVASAKAGGESRGWTDILSESQIRAISRGDASIRKYVEEIADDLAQSSFKTPDSPDFDEVRKVILEQAADLLGILEGGGDIASRYKQHMEYLKTDSKSFRHYSDNGNQLTTISPWTKAANVLAMQALGKQIQAVATGALSIADNVPIGRQAETLFDSMKVLLTENKKMGMMWGLDGKAQQQYTISPTLQKMKERSMKEITQQNDEYFNELKGLIRQERWDELEDLTELWALSGGKVRTLTHINEYLKSKIYGGRMDDIHIKGALRKELQGTFFNSVLSGPATPIKAWVGTNMIAKLRPMQAWAGSLLRGDQKGMFMATMQMENMGKAWAESLQLAKANWDMGVKRKNQSYQGKFDFETDLKDWKGMKKYYEKYGSPKEQIAYGALDKVVDFNTSPWVKYSVNAMGSGDAAARTLIGRQYMRQKAAAAAWDLKAKDPLMTDQQLKEIVFNTEEQFRDEIFKLDKDGNYIVSDKAASMAGDEAAMTRTLQENFKGFELISNIPGMKAFFPFVRTGFNMLDVTFQHTPLAIFRDKYADLRKLAEAGEPSQILLNKYGIKPEAIPQELAIMEGRMAMGTSVIGLATLLAMSGNITGDYPVDPRDRELWQAKGIKPKSFKVGDTYISYEKLEIFNSIFSTTANVVGNADLLGEERTDEWMKKLTYMTAAVIVDQSMLSGVEDLARLMNPRSAEDLLLKSGTKFVRSHIPFAGLSGQLGDIVDSNQKEANTFLELLSQRDAFFKSAVPAKYDILAKDRSGQELRYGPEEPLWRLFNSISPIGVYKSHHDPVKEGLEAIRFDLPGTLRTYQGQELNSLEISQLQKELATGGLREDLEKVISKPGFKKAVKRYRELGLKESQGYKLKDQIFYSAVSAVFRKHKKIAMQKMLRKNGVLQGSLIAQKMRKSAGRAGDYEQIEYLMTMFPK